MNNIDLNRWAQIIHDLAVEKGWWDGKEKDAREVFVMIHSELSEALEAYRDGQPMLWHKETGRDTMFEDKEVYKVLIRYKPEGIAVELVDAVIRLLDWYASTGDCRPIEINIARAYDTYGVDEATPAPILINALHEGVCGIRQTCAGWARTTEATPRLVGLFIAVVFGWLRANGLDPEELMTIKHEFNKGRAYRHGGKLC